MGAQYGAWEEAVEDYEASKIVKADTSEHVLDANDSPSTVQSLQAAIAKKSEELAQEKVRSCCQRRIVGSKTIKIYCITLKSCSSFFRMGRAITC